MSRVKIRTGPHTHVWKESRRESERTPKAGCCGPPADFKPVDLGRATLISVAQASPQRVVPHTWAVGVTTVPERRSNGSLLRTLASLRAAGFDDPRLFVDGATVGFDGLASYVTYRYPKVRTVGNWILSAWELLIRNPTAARFAMFQDDVILCRGVRQYLDEVAWPERSYLNLHTFGLYEPMTQGKPDGFHPGGPADSNRPDDGLQRGYGGGALAFTREGLSACLSSFHLPKKVQDTRLDKRGDGWTRGQVKIDGAVVTAMNLAGWCEMIHKPSLAEHLGAVSSMNGGGYPASRTFRGESFDALSLLKT